MRRYLPLCACALLAGLILAQAPGDPYAPLRLYDGTWNATGQRDGKPVSNHIVNVCKQLGLYFACQQTVDGKVGSLIVFVPTDTPGQYHTQAVLPQGYATGRGDLDIQGERWTYSSKGADDKGKTVYFRTLNVFHGPDHIHYTLQKSSDGQHWTTDGEGDEIHLPKAGG
ncbi:MAG: hypothetical protein ACRD2D_14120 [Terriglobales bacterium]